MRKEFPNSNESKPARYSYGDSGFAAEVLRDSIGKLFQGPEMTPLGGCGRSQRRRSAKDSGNRWRLGAAVPPVPSKKFPPEWHHVTRRSWQVPGGALHQTSRDVSGPLPAGAALLEHLLGVDHAYIPGLETDFPD